MPRTAPRLLTRPVPRPAARPGPARSRRVRALAGVLALGTAALLSGCGLRLETDPPAEPAPDAAEQVRRDAVDDALALVDAAGAATSGADEAVAVVLGLVSSTAADQVAALGGVYESGLPEPGGATQPPTPTATGPAAGPADVLALLGDAASEARAGARTADDPGLARLLAAVAASRAQLTDRLAAALGTEPPVVDAEPEDGFTTGGDADGSGSGDGSAALPSASTSAGASASPEPPATGSSDALGADLDRTDALALVLAEDQAGYGFEVAAARLADDERARARSAAEAHRAAAAAWAEAVGVAGTAEDPRRVAYELDGDVSTAEAVRTFAAGLLTDLAAVHADAMLGTGASTADRTAAVDGLRTSAVAALAWGATPTALPGLPPTAPTPTPTAG
ncbi:DUF4439 domain-containing protein [Cellulomonas sp. C5510]|uniref:DUF4439 domain-containing protein n=1 Tax=Cellulomonas sp. C5510 TaxID=2871170 RepID=UPI001C96DC24|nr:DUF4439 domain-containing protein [Cellulomonas sp. C5510]QZN84541.1 ferritin-like domain-containing protein [Cellulomonas sp. C5510]